MIMLMAGILLTNLLAFKENNDPLIARNDLVKCDEFYLILADNQLTIATNFISQHSLLRADREL